MTSETINLAKDLIARESVTPNDCGCQDLIARRLNKKGFDVEHMPADSVSNLWCRRGSQSPVLSFAGHTDVVPRGQP